MHTDMEARACDLAEYLLANNATVRAAAKQFGVSKSTVHKDLTERLEKIDRPNPSVRGGFSASAGRRVGICSAAYAVFYARGREKEFIWRVCT